MNSPVFLSVPHLLFKPVMEATATLPSRFNSAPQRRLQIPKLFSQALSDQLAGRFDRALAGYAEILSLDPQLADAHNNSGAALMAQGRTDEAAAHYRLAIALSPHNAAFHFNLGNTLAALGRIDEAMLRFRRALALKPNYAEACNNLGHMLLAQGESEAAALQFERAIAIGPADAKAHTNLGNLLRDQGRFTEAMAHYDRAIALDPRCVEAHYDRSEIRNFRAGDPDLSRLEALASRCDLSARQKPYVHFALAKALEDCGDYPRAFSHLRQGNAAKREQIDYDQQQTNKLFSRVASVFSQGTLERLSGSGDSSDVPIFILGMPRSGAASSNRSSPAIHKSTAPGSGRTCGPLPEDPSPKASLH